MVVNVVEAFCPSLQPLLPNLNNVPAEPAPETNVTAATDPAAIQFVVDHSWIGYVMVSRQVKLELFAPVARLTTELLRIGLALLVTFPQLKLMVLTILVSLPVILAAKTLSAPSKGAPIRLLMALLMLPAARISKSWNH